MAILKSLIDQGAWNLSWQTLLRIRHPRELGASEVEAFLTNLAVERQVAAATQTQALSALLFLYREVLQMDLPWLTTLVRAKPSQHVPVVLSLREVNDLLNCLEGGYALMARLLYGTGMRLMECVRLRVKDLEFDRREVVVRQGKGGKDRMTTLLAGLASPLQASGVVRSRPAHPSGRA